MHSAVVEAFHERSKVTSSKVTHFFKRTIKFRPPGNNTISLHNSECRALQIGTIFTLSSPHMQHT
jgi:hypothetical protein